MPWAAALASGLPIFIGAAHGELGLGLAGSLGGLVFLHLPATRLSHRRAWLVACAFAITGSHAPGMPGHPVPALVVPLLVIITILVTMVCRFCAAPGPTPQPGLDAAVADPVVNGGYGGACPQRATSRTTAPSSCLPWPCPACSPPVALLSREPPRGMASCSTTGLAQRSWAKRLAPPGTAAESAWPQGCATALQGDQASEFLNAGCASLAAWPGP